MAVATTLKKTALGLLVASLMPFLWPVFADAFCFEEAGQTYGINPALLQAIARAESGLQASAVHNNKNGSSDLGLMQINSAWVDTLQLNRGRLLSDPCYNVMTGTKILKDCIDRWGYDWQAVGCYNAASERKRVDYAWKIYHELKREGMRKKTLAKGKERPAEADAPAQSLYFKVRSMEGRESGGHP